MIAWLLDTLLYTGLLIGLVLVLRRPMGKWFGPQIAYALWALPFLRLMLPPIVLPASLAPKPEPVFVVARVELAEAAPLPAAASVEVLPATVAAPTWEWADVAAVAFSIWLGGALAFLAWRVVTYRKMRRELLADARPVGEVGKIRLVETPALAAPVAFGVRDKVIGLPPLFMAQPDIVARDLAIAHELAHHRGHDLLANFAAQALLALHWCNPLAWYGWRAMRRDQEAACDARVVAGRGREERALYAALIADIATGPRLALAAPMACPVLGDKSIIHRLKSLSMPDASPRRRWLGRALVGMVALALPLTASISYAAAKAQAPEAASPALGEATGISAAPTATSAPAGPEAPRAGEAVAQNLALQSEAGASSPVADVPAVQHFAVQPVIGAPVPTMSAMPPMPPGPPTPPSPPAPNVRANWDSARFDTEMEDFGRAMEAWGKEWEKWGERFGEQYAEQARVQALAAAEAAKNAPEVVESCDENERRRTRTADGRQRVVICERQIEAQALASARAGLRSARASIARNSGISEDVRREILRDLDEEIAQMGRGD